MIPAYRNTAEIQVSKEPEKKAFSLPWARRCATAAVSYLQKRVSAQKSFASVYKPGFFTKPGIMENGNIVKKMDTVVRRQVISEDTSASMREILEGVVEVPDLPPILYPFI